MFFSKIRCTASQLIIVYEIEVDTGQKRNQLAPISMSESKPKTFSGKDWFWWLFYEHIFSTESLWAASFCFSSRSCPLGSLWYKWQNHSKLGLTSVYRLKERRKKPLYYQRTLHTHTPHMGSRSTTAPCSHRLWRLARTDWRLQKYIKKEHFSHGSILYSLSNFLNIFVFDPLCNQFDSTLETPVFFTLFNFQFQLTRPCRSAS